MTWSTLKLSSGGVYYQIIISIFNFCWITLTQIQGQIISEPGPFRLVLRLADEDCGDKEDSRIIDLLLTRFRLSTLPKADCKFNGFDIGDGYVWFYFVARDLPTLQHYVFPLIDDCKIRKGSHFEIRGIEKSYLAA